MKLLNTLSTNVQILLSDARVVKQMFDTLKSNSMVASNLSWLLKNFTSRLTL